MKPAAAAILVFDLLTQNYDRKDENPNCFVKGDDVRIFDHDLSLVSSQMIIGYKPPWQTGGLRAFEVPGFHIFLRHLKGKGIALDDVKTAWKALTLADFNTIAGLLPDEWSIPAHEIASIMEQLEGINQNIDDCFQEVMRVLQ